jgi:hypothetical protein
MEVVGQTRLQPFRPAPSAAGPGGGPARVTPESLYPQLQRAAGGQAGQGQGQAQGQEGQGQGQGQAGQGQQQGQGPGRQGQGRAEPGQGQGPQLGGESGPGAPSAAGATGGGGDGPAAGGPARLAAQPHTPSAAAGGPAAPPAAPLPAGAPPAASPLPPASVAAPGQGGRDPGLRAAQEAAAALRCVPDLHNPCPPRRAITAAACGACVRACVRREGSPVLHRGAHVGSATRGLPGAEE